ncbi:helix-turn-helix domain-containing protein [Amycolatopsis thermoflava]|uniref:helix-turn-helix domain-containing protein n=1 Tax=Amycolatopsis thermoflava TaxID=84480 RepID=UPI0014289402|nr:helix-turn-helix transcriptional regulator [Amycolatopsis thermoflava]
MVKRNDEMVPVKGTVMAAIRKGRGLSRPELARRVGCSPSHLGNVEAGRKRAKESLVNRIARELYVPTSRLIDHEQLKVAA